MAITRDHETWPEALEYLRTRGEAVHVSVIAEAIGKTQEKVAGVLAHHANRGELVERVGKGTYRATEGRAAARPAPKPTLTSNGQKIPKSDIDYIMKLPDGKLLLSIGGEMWVAVRIGG